MKIFLAGIIQGSIAEAAIHSQDWRGPIKEALARHVPEAEVYCHYTQHPQSIGYDLPQLKATLEDGLRRAAQCDLLVAYLPSASMGTALEMYEAARHGAAVLTITPLSANWVVRAYSDHIFPDLQAFEAFLSTGSLAELLSRKAFPNRPRAQ
jgi:hypothetical protein